MTGQFTKLVSPTLKDMFVEQLERMIFDGTLKPGDKLPSEREMAQQTGVSLAIAHSGIRQLAALGFLRVAPRQGVFVTDYVREGDVNTLKEVMSFTGMPLGEDLLVPIATLRRTLETDGIRAACENRTDADIAYLEEILARFADCKGGDLGELEFDFLHGIALASKNMYYPMMLRTFKPFYILFSEEFGARWGRAALLDGMRQQLDAIREKDAQKAVFLARASVDLWVRGYLESAKKQEGLPSPYQFGTEAQGPEEVQEGG